MTWIWYWIGAVIACVIVIVLRSLFLSIKASTAYRVAKDAAELRLAGRAEEAVRLMETVLPAAGDDGVLLSHYAAALFDAGRIAEARQTFRQAIKIEPDSIESMYGLGHCVLEENPLEAYNLFNSALIQDPSLASALEGRGLAGLSLGRLAEATKDFQKVIQLDERSHHGHMNLGVALIALGKLEEAERNFRTAVALATEDFQCLSNLGSFLGAAGRHEEAIDFLARAVTAKPDSIEERVQLAFLLQKLNRDSEAISHLEAAARIAPENSDCVFRLALLYQKAGRLDDAEKAIHLAERLDPKLGKGLSIAKPENSERMNTMDEIEFFSRLKLFDGIKPEDMQRLIAAGMMIEYDASGVILEENKDAHSLLVIVDGDVDVRKKTVGSHSQTLARLGSGATIGEMSYVDRSPRSASVIAIGKTRIWRIPYTAMDSFCAERQEAGLIFVKNLAAYIAGRVRTLNEEQQAQVTWGVKAVR